MMVPLTFCIQKIHSRWKKRLERTEPNPPVYFVMYAAIMIGTDALLLSVVWFLLKASPSVLIAALGTSLAAIVPTLATIWVFVYSLQARIKSKDLVRGKRLDHYKSIRNNLYEGEFVHSSIIGRIIQGDFLSANLKLDTYYEFNKVAGLYSGFFEDHLKADLTHELFDWFKDSEEKVKQHDKNIDLLGSEVTELIRLNIQKNNLNVVENGRVSNADRIYANVEQVLSEVANTWYGTCSFTQEPVKYVPSRYMKTVLIKGDSVVVEDDQREIGNNAGTTNNAEEMFELMLNDLLNNEILFNKFAESFAKRISFEKLNDSLKERMEAISKKIKNETYTTTLKCCPYSNIKL